MGGWEIMETCTLVMPPQKRRHLRPICRCKGASQSCCLVTYLCLGLWFICLRWDKAPRWGTFSEGGSRPVDWDLLILCFIILKCSHLVALPYSNKSWIWKAKTHQNRVDKESPFSTKITINFACKISILVKIDTCTRWINILLIKNTCTNNLKY
jgi:hypothetical protein